MANNTVYLKLKIVDEATGSIKKVIVSTNELRGVVQKVTDEVRKNQRTIVDWAQAAQAADMLGQSIEKMYNWTQEVTGIYQIQAVAETQLLTVMRQRMKATEDEVDSIKRLCSTQQELGVIGDEVQLSGAQQMATFLNEKASLDTLIPAMNNLLAQQNGLNATNQDAVSIGNLMGKAMQGQTEVLQRVGITFSEAQKHVLKYGTESERAAMLAQVITDNVGNMNAELAKTDAGKQKQLDNTIGDLYEHVGALVQPIMKAITISYQGLTVFTQLSKSFSSFKSLDLAIRPIIQKLVSTNAVSIRLGATMTVLRARMNGVAVGATTAKMALQGLLISTGVGAAIAVLSAIIYKLKGSASETADGLNDLSRSAGQLKRASEAYATASADAKAAMDLELASLKQLIDSHGDDSWKVEELNRKYGDAFGTYNTASQWYDILTQKSAAYCQAIGMEAQARELATQQAQNALRLAELEARMKDMRDAGTDTETTFAPMGAGVIDTSSYKLESAEYRKLREEAEQLGETQDLLKRKFEACTDAMAAARLELGTFTDAVRTPPEESAVPASLLGLDETRLNERLRQLQAAMDAAPTMEAKLSFVPEIDSVKKTLDDIAATIDAHKFRLRFEAGKDKLPELDAKAIMPKVELSGIVGEADRAIEAVRQKFEQSKIDVNVDNKGMNKFGKNADNAIDKIDRLGSSLSSMGSNLGLPALDVAGTIAQAIANVALSYSEAMTAGSLVTNPWGWLAFAFTGLAQMTAVIAGIKQATAFAAGGIVSGPTYALVGEYAGASNNPEVIAPLDKLRGMLAQPEAAVGYGQVEFRIRGRELVGILSREDNLKRRS